MQRPLCAKCYELKRVHSEQLGLDSVTHEKCTLTKLSVKCKVNMHLFWFHFPIKADSPNCYRHLPNDTCHFLGYGHPIMYSPCHSKLRDYSSAWLLLILFFSSACRAVQKTETFWVAHNHRLQFQSITAAQLHANWSWGLMTLPSAEVRLFPICLSTVYTDKQSFSKVSDLPTKVSLSLTHSLWDI